MLRSLLAGPGMPVWTTMALVLAGVLLGTNAAWHWVFFRREDLWLGWGLFGPYILVALALALVLFRVAVPWPGGTTCLSAISVHAAWWGYSVWRLNRPAATS